MPSSPSGLYWNRVAFISFHLGRRQPVKVAPRTVAREGHPIIDANPTMFAPLTVDYDLDTEPASAEPAAAGQMADDADPEVAQLKRDAVGLGIGVDGRWSVRRLRAEVAKARAAQAPPEGQGG